MKIVIVDDNPMNVALLRHMVRDLDDCEAVTFTSSADGVVWCATNLPDLVIVDYMMPPPDGLAFIEAFRAMEGREDIPLLMITASSENEVRYQALSHGANDFLTKPIDRNEFLARARNMLALRRSQRALADRAEWLAGEVRKATADIVERERETVVRLSRAAEYRDPETGAHILRMAKYSELIARQLGLPPDQQTLLLQAAPMHDVGKVGTPDHILLKPGRLDADELVVMRQHALIGYEILAGSESPLLQAAALIARTHHEKFDGSGYPDGLKGEEIPLFGRIVAVADVFDALTSERPYKKAWTLEAAVDFLQQQRGLHFDPACIDAFLSDWDGVLAIRNRYRDDEAS